MSLHRYKLEDLVYLLIFLLALGVRALNLGAGPLSDGEAAWAMQALEVANRVGQLSPGPQSGYIALTGAAFAVLGSTAFLARLLPALAGALLVWAPYFFRRRFGREAALLLALGLALDPGLTVGSRLVGGPLPALAFALLALGLAYNGRSLAAGICAGLALLAGPAVLHGLLGMGLAWGAFLLLERAAGSRGANQPEQSNAVKVPFDLRRAGIAGLVTALAVSTLLGRFPAGLGAWVGALPAYLQGWVQPSGIPVLRLLAALPLYQPLGLIFGLLGVIRAWREERRDLQLLSLWLLAALLVVLLYPGRQVIDLVWVLIPLWGLAAAELARHLSERAEPVWVSVSLAGAIFILMALFGLNLAGVGQAGLAATGGPLRLGVLAGTLALQVVMVLLVGLGWNWHSARWGLVFGVCASLGLYSLAGMWGATQRSFSLRQELWSQTPAAGDADLLLKTLSDLSIWDTGRADAIDISVAVESPALRWALRNFPNVRYLPESQVLSLANSPGLVITPQSQDQPALASAYRGQDFVWWVYPGWESILPPDPVRWLAVRQAPVVQEQLIVWARGDIFPGGTFTPLQEQSVPQQLAPQDVDPEVQEIP